MGRRRRPLAARLLGWTGGVVIMTAALVGSYTAFLMGDFPAMAGILILVLAAGTLFLRRFT